MSPDPSFFQRFFLANTTFARLAVLALLIGSWVAYSNLIKETTPDLEIGVGIVSTEWPGGERWPARSCSWMTKQASGR